MVAGSYCFVVVVLFCLVVCLLVLVYVYVYVLLELFVLTLSGPHNYIHVHSILVHIFARSTRTVCSMYGGFMSKCEYHHGCANSLLP